MATPPDFRSQPQVATAPGPVPDLVPPSAFWLWLQSDFPWLASPLRLVVGAVVLLVLGLAGQQLVIRLSQPPVQVLPVEQQQLRRLMDQVEECRGTESLLVMLPPGAEREAAISRLQRQQRQINTWLRDNSSWLAASQGQQAVADLREAATAWQALQQRIADADAPTGRTGLVKEPRALMTGPSADAYRHLATALERLARRYAQ